MVGFCLGVDFHREGLIPTGPPCLVYWLVVNIELMKKGLGLRISRSFMQTYTLELLLVWMSVV